MDTNGAPDKLTIHSLRKTLLQYTKPNLRQAILQMINTFIPYIALWIISQGCRRYLDINR
jgi:hypothetical protein